VQNGIEIDTSGFYGVHIDTVANTLTAGGNVHFANITGAVYAAGREIRRSIILF